MRQLLDAMRAAPPGRQGAVLYIGSSKSWPGHGELDSIAKDSRLGRGPNSTRRIR